MAAKMATNIVAKTEWLSIDRFGWHLNNLLEINCKKLKIQIQSAAKIVAENFVWLELRSFMNQFR